MWCFFVITSRVTHCVASTSVFLVHFVNFICNYLFVIHESEHRSYSNTRRVKHSVAQDVHILSLLLDMSSRTSCGKTRHHHLLLLSFLSSNHQSQSTKENWSDAWMMRKTKLRILQDYTPGLLHSHMTDYVCPLCSLAKETNLTESLYLFYRDLSFIAWLPLWFSFWFNLRMLEWRLFHGFSLILWSE